MPTRSFSDLHRPKAYFSYVGGKRRGRQQSLSPRGWQLLKLLIICAIWLGTSTVQAQTDPNSSITESRQRALLIYQRLAGVRVPIDHPDLIYMESRLAANDLEGVAARAMQNPNFYRITVKNFALKMSNQSETIRVPFNDMTATIMGIIRDEINAKEILTGNFYYRGQSGLSDVRSDILEDILMSDNHYMDLETQDNQDKFNAQGGLASILVRVIGQVVKNGDSTTANPSASGVITSRAYMKSTATMGTNRAIIADTLQKFTCRSIEEASDTSAPDIHIGRDVDRTPGGDPKTFANKCQGCHSILDAFQPATAYIDFEDGYLKHGLILQSSGQANSDDVDLIDANTRNGIPIKMTRNEDVFPKGRKIRNINWTNHAVGAGNKPYFQWKNASSGSHLKGSGLKQYASLLANSGAFSKCMVRRVYQSVCKRDISQFEAKWVNQISTEFESQAHKYNLKWLFGRVATDPNCIGKR